MQHVIMPDFTSLCCHCLYIQALLSQCSYKRHIFYRSCCTLRTFTAVTLRYCEAATGKAMCLSLATTVHQKCIYWTIDNRHLWPFSFLAKMLQGVMKHVAAETAASFKMKSCRRQAARLRLLSKVTNFTVHRRLCGKLLARCSEWNKITAAVIIDVIYCFAALCCLQLIYI